MFPVNSYGWIRSLLNGKALLCWTVANPSHRRSRSFCELVHRSAPFSDLTNCLMLIVSPRAVHIDFRNEGFLRASPSLAISREAPREIRETCAEGNTTTKAVSTETGWQHQRLAASYPIAKGRVPLQPIVLEYRCAYRISLTRWGRTSFFRRKC